jgi:hypothetical protein
VKHGFSAGLKQFSTLNQNSPALLVENVSASETRLRARRMVRELRHEIQPRRPLMDFLVNAAARLLRISTSWLSQEIRRPQPWGRLVERIGLRQTIEGEWERSWPKMFLEQAIAALRIRVSDLRPRPEKKSSARNCTASRP